MYSLTVNFKTVEELHAFVSGKLEVKDTPSPVREEALPLDIPPVIEEKKPAKKSTKKASPPIEVASEPEFEEVESPYTAPAFDREGAIVTAQKLVAQLKGTGIADDKLMPAIHEVYAAAGCPINLKISQLSDDQLSTFIPLFEMKVKSIVSAPKQQASASFI
jgi:hypothetical protein